MADWTGNSVFVFKSLSASNHCDMDRAEHDYYATDPVAAERLLKIEPELSDKIWECACGENAFIPSEGLSWAMDFNTCSIPSRWNLSITKSAWKHSSRKERSSSSRISVLITHHIMPQTF